MLGNRHVALVFALGAAMAAVSVFSTGCELIASVDRTKIPPATGGGSVGGSGGMGGGGGGSTPECTVATAVDDCPVTGSDCVTATCPDGECDTENAALGTTCTDDNDPNAQVCDDGGSCVECNGDDDCTAPDTCDQNVCVPPHCTDGELSGDETDEDCGGSCAPCVNGDGCIVANDCESGFCGPAGAGGAGGGGATGECAACSDGDCDDAEWCDETVDLGTCTPDNGQGEECGAHEECTGNVNCVDDVCCDAACPGDCEACDESGNVGTCTNLADSVVCRADAGDCDVAENCTGSSGTCPANVFEAEFTACGSALDDDCTNPDSCDDSGACDDRDATAGTVCNTPTADCHLDDTCDGNGTCTDNGFANEFTACGDATDGECTDPDSCDDSGSCQPRHEPVSTMCGDGIAEPTCDPDHCDDAGGCTDEPDTVDGTSCPENGSGTCQTGVCTP